MKEPPASNVSALRVQDIRRKSHNNVQSKTFDATVGMRAAARLLLRWIRNSMRMGRKACAKNDYGRG